MSNLSDACKDAIRALQEVVRQETGLSGEVVAVVVGRAFGASLGLWPGCSVILRDPLGDLRVTVASEALDVPLANRIALLESVTADLVRTTEPLRPQRPCVICGAPPGTPCDKTAVVAVDG